jgi:hypothetical protein
MKDTPIIVKQLQKTLKSELVEKTEETAATLILNEWNKN